MKVVDLHFWPDDAKHPEGAAVNRVNYSVLHGRLTGAVDAAESKYARSKRSVLRGILILM